MENVSGPTTPRLYTSIQDPLREVLIPDRSWRPVRSGAVEGVYGDGATGDKAEEEIQAARWGWRGHRL